MNYSDSLSSLTGGWLMNTVSLMDVRCSWNLENVQTGKNTAAGTQLDH